MPRFDPPAGVIPLDRRLPSAPSLADIPSRLAWLRDTYGGHTAIGTAITARDTGITYRVDAETTPYVAFTPDGAYPDPAHPHGLYILTPLSDADAVAAAQAAATAALEAAAIVQPILDSGGYLLSYRLDGTARLLASPGITVTDTTYTLRGRTLATITLTEAP